MTGLKQYPAYRHSQVDWLGDIPTHWTVGRVGFAYRLTLGKMVNASFTGGTLRPYLRAGNVQDDGMDLSEIKEMPITVQEASLLSLCAGDVVVVEGGAGYGRSAVLNEDLGGWAFQNHIIRARPIGEQEPRYLDYLIKVLRSLGHFEALGTYATIPNLSSEKLAGIEFPFLPLEEQQLIADRLDRETAEIDAFIADQEELIGLLAERRAATISHAVTKGHDPTAPMKDSGIEWIGKTPETWAIVNARRLFYQPKNSANEGDIQLAATQEFGVIPQHLFTEITGNRVTVVLKGFEILKHVEPGDFVISMRSFQGGLEYSKYAGKISSAYVVLAPQVPIVDEYFIYLFKSLGYISALRSTSNLVRDGQAMRFSNFVQVPLPVPPLEEQKAVVQLLEKEIGEIDATKRDAEQAIRLSRERRKALISAAVTGKIDVRGVGVVA